MGLTMYSMFTVLGLTLLLQTASLDTLEEENVRIPRAIGGQGFHRGTYPWLVLLRATIVTERLFGVIPIAHYHLYCGGVIISQRWLLTAAHCFTSSQGSTAAADPGNWEARMATSRIRPTVRQRMADLVGRVINHDDIRQWEIDVDTIVLHPGYVHTEFHAGNDIALVKLSRHVPNVSAVRPIPVPDYGGGAFPQAGANCIAIGWGCTTPGGSPSTWAQQINMPTLPPGRCQRVYGLDSMQGRLCAGYTQGGVGVCLGDSGGPLVCPRTTSSRLSSISSSSSRNNYILAGIVSFTSRNNPQSFPAVFTKVQDFEPWIQRTMARY